jgi:Ca2+-binding RTX toxin-like protein
MKTSVLAVGGVALLGLLLQGTADAGPEPLTCNGKPVTIMGTEEDNFDLRGTAGDDVIHGLGGEDNIRGGPGNDTICGGDDDDVLRPGTGDDWLDGGSHDATHDFGGDFVSFTGGENVAGGVSVDLATGTATGLGTETLFRIENIRGTNGPDVLKGNGARNLIVAHLDNDQLIGRGGNDVLSGESGRDYLSGGGGK